MSKRKVNHISRRKLVGSGMAVLGGLGVAKPLHAGIPPKKWYKEFDVIIFGCGVSGGCAAVEAVDAGAKVLIVDSGGARSAASHGSTFYMGGGTALQKACEVKDSPDDMLNHLLAIPGAAADEARLRKYVEESVANFDWLVRMGLPFVFTKEAGSLKYTGSERTHPYSVAAPAAPRGHRPVTDRSGSSSVHGGAQLQKILVARAKAGGATMLLSGKGKTLLSDTDGRVVGAVIDDGDGNEKAYRARKGIILATGGFAFNREMVAKHAPRLLDCTPIDLAWNNGWGIRAAQSVGAGVRLMSAANVTFPLYPPDYRKRGVLVDAHGRRFLAEDSYYGLIGDKIVREQSGRAFLIVDRDGFGAAKGPGDVIAAVGNSISELERKIGIPSPLLQQTVDHYNQSAQSGQDVLFHKARAHLHPVAKPPYTAISASLNTGAVFVYFTLGGLHTSAHAEVLDLDGRQMPGLYAVGRTSSALTAPYYYASGLSLGECVTFGRIAGREAAKIT